MSRAAALTWLAGTLAFVLSASVLRDRAERVEVLVAARDIPAGTELTTGMVRSIELDAHSPLATTLVLSSRLRPGMVVRGVIAEGSPIRTADLVAAAEGDRLRSMSIQVDRAKAVGGDLAVGDRVDVIHVVGGTPTYVVAGVQVIDVASSQSGRGLTGSGAAGGFFVVVRVDARQALALAGAMDNGRRAGHPLDGGRTGRRWDDADHDQGERRMTDRRVGIVYGSRDWRKALQLHVRNHVRGTRILVVRDERMAIEEPLDVLIVDDETSFLTGDLVELLRAKGVRLIGVHDPVRRRHGSGAPEQRRHRCHPRRGQHARRDRGRHRAPRRSAG